MGRPRKSLATPSPVQQESKEEVVNGNTETVEPVYTRVALGIYKNPKTGNSHVIEIPFNEDGDVGAIKIISEGDGMDVARERFRIEASNKIL